MMKFVSAFLGIAVSIGFMMLVGSPHYIETIIGLVLGLIVGFGSYFMLGKRKNDY